MCVLLCFQQTLFTCTWIPHFEMIRGLNNPHGPPPALLEASGLLPPTHGWYVLGESKFAFLA